MQLRLSFRIAGQAGSGRSAQTLGVMQLEPRNLGVPLHPRQWLWLKAIIIILVVAIALLFLSPGFGIPYIASMLTAAPVLLPYLLSFKVQKLLRTSGLVVRVGTFVAVVLYLSFSKQVLAPVLATWLKSVLGLSLIHI